MDLVKPISAEQSLSTSNTVSSAVVVRIFCSAGPCKVTNDTTTGSFTMPTGSVSYVYKTASDTLSCTGTALATSIAITTG